MEKIQAEVPYIDNDLEKDYKYEEKDNVLDEEEN